MTGRVLVIDKPKGMTSHDVVSSVKKKISASKVGHLGTLDPNATGVLVLVIDGATKLARFLEGGKKVYDATMKLGEETDTYDSEGKVTEVKPFESVGAEDITAAVEGFKGTISQLPPMYSAVKKGGTPLYKLARKGMVVEREPKEVEIYEIGITSVEMPYVMMSVSCSRGTYIRTLCHDLGKVLGCGAHLAELRRTGSGPFTIDKAVALDSEPAALRSAAISVDEALEMAASAVELDKDALERIESGATLIGIKDFPTLNQDEMVRLMRDGRLQALASHKGEGIFKVLKRFAGDRKIEEPAGRANVN